MMKKEQQLEIEDGKGMEITRGRIKAEYGIILEERVCRMHK